MSCNRCGQCCYYYCEGKRLPCKHLVKLRSGRTLCRIYRTRKGVTVYKTPKVKVICIDRVQVPLNFTDCPYNKPEWSDANAKICKEVVRN